MDIGSWKNKIQVVQNFERNSPLLSGNSMGIYFESRSENSLTIHFKPLNEVFKEEVFHAENGILINFERDLIDEDDIEYALDVMSLFNKYPRYNLNDPNEVRQLRKSIDLIKAEYYGDRASYIMLKTLLKVLLLHLIRYRNDGFLVQDLNQKRVFQFLELMETHFLNETNPEFYAHEIGISLKRLNQILKEKLNLTAKQVIQQRQITEAKRRLVRSEVSTKELAFELGFGSLSSFSRFFKKNVGVNPSVYKRQN
ncbi:helix-turn-helix domain-containing protein [Maribacter polysaccharolyticus]|uniref:helix-turn-helix domain-containing protein n=1 Tax=Maribacter polysaccharolyticus TaxID=3020831 RepID=UPI00237F113B|nr:helix-turn-helix domain-containing protein [Maribacter polysaccharolyticus]MDE3741787.1 helix-turn-helix domain-containing protein [Maribacter polysaccharolyticus]